MLFNLPLTNGFIVIVAGDVQDAPAQPEQQTWGEKEQKERKGGMAWRGVGFGGAQPPTVLDGAF